MSDQRPNTGTWDDEYGVRLPTPYGPTGTHRDVITARDELVRVCSDPLATTRMRASYADLWSEATPQDLEHYWTVTRATWAAALGSTGSLLWVSEDVAHGVDVAADSFPEPGPGWRERFELPVAGLALSQSPLFDRVMLDGQLAVHTAGLAVAGFMWAIWEQGVCVIPVANTASMSWRSQQQVAGEQWPLVPLGPIFLPGDGPYDFHIVRRRADESVTSDFEGWGGSGFHWARFLLSLDAWASQVAETEDREVRAARRTRGGKRKQKRPPVIGTVRTVKLRRPAPRPASDSPTGEGSGRTYSHRWIVGGDTGGFWRQQACGPRWSQRRPVWISPHVKGPEGAPLVTKTTVIKVDR